MPTYWLTLRPKYVSLEPPTITPLLLYFILSHFYFFTFSLFLSSSKTRRYCMSSFICAFLKLGPVKLKQNIYIILQFLGIHSSFSLIISMRSTWFSLSFLITSGLKTPFCKLNGFEQWKRVVRKKKKKIPILR